MKFVTIRVIGVFASLFRHPNYPSFPIARVGQTSMARCAASVSSGVSGCLKNERQSRHGCTPEDSELPRDRDGTTRSSYPHTTGRARSRAVCLVCPPWRQVFGRTVSAGGRRKARVPFAAADFYRQIRSNCKIHLPLEGIDPHNKDAHLIANAESFTRSPADELSPCGLK